MSDPIMLQYAVTPRTSRLAIASVVISAIALPLFIFIIPAFIALAFAISANAAMQKSPQHIGGSRLVSIAITLSAIALFLGVGFYLIGPGLRKNHGMSSRSYCSVNLTGILKSANVYANDNADAFPIVPYAPYSAALNNPSFTVTGATADAAVDSMFSAPPANVAGSPLASLWLLVLKGYTIPKQYICRSDPRVSAPAPVARGVYPTHFASGTNISYSLAYPWTAGGGVSKLWTSIVDAGLPLMSDMAPLQGTGSPARVLNPAAVPSDQKTWNSEIHDGDGQNVGWSDAHASFERRPNIGYLGDNIFTTSGTGTPQQFGGFPATPLFPPITSGVWPFDVIMVPVRNATMGAM